ncbi:MAG: L-dopachrome tautomerase-related protein [Pseudomonadota bacterium]
MRRVFAGFAAVGLLVLLVIRLVYGGGSPYADLTTTPMLDDEALEIAFSYDQPIGNVAVDEDGSIFFTVHPEAKPQGNKVLKVSDGIALPFPDGAAQQQLFKTPLGIRIDARGHLWTIDHGGNARAPARLMSFDAQTGEVLHDHEFSRDIAPIGSYLQDLVISNDGATVVIADIGFLRRDPALIVYDTRQRTARRVLSGDPSVTPQKWLINNPLRKMRFYGGLVSMMPGVDGLALDPANAWLYYGAMSHDGLYRIDFNLLRGADSSDVDLADSIERFSHKPLSDGLSRDTAGHIYITDVEHNAILRVDQRRRLETLVKSRRIRWPDALSFGPEDWLYVADSALPVYLLRSQDAIEDNAPYHIYRFRSGHAGIPGQ